MSQPVLEVSKLVKDYDDYRAVDHISFAIQKGQVMGLLGPNGAGKSTTIQMLTGITTPTGGTIKYFGHDFAKHRQACLQRINFASAYNTLQGRIAVRENLRVFAGLYGVAKPERKINELLEYFQIDRLAKTLFWDLSAGERTRVNLAKSLLNDPELVLMDEPTASLDPDIADKTLTLIENLRADRGVSILFTSHNMAEVERVCDQVIFLDKGVIVSQDTPQNHTKKIDQAEVLLRFKGSKADLQQLLEKRGARFVFDTPKDVRITTANHQIPELLAALHNADLQITDIDIHKPTLEDVFLNIARGSHE